VEEEFRMSVRTWSTHVGFALLLGACGGDEGDPSNQGDGDGAPQGAAADGKVGDSDPDLSVADLNEAEWKAACLDIGGAGGSRELIHGPCIISGLLSSIIGGECMETYDLCLGEPEDTQCDTEETRDFTCESSLADIVSLEQDHRTPECDAIADTCPSFQTAASQDEEEF
jgi:hypothetical protein